MFNKLVAQSTAFFYSYKNDQRGVTAVEYALIGVAMAAALTLVFAKDGSLMTNLKGSFDAIGTNLGTLQTQK